MQKTTRLVATYSLLSLLSACGSEERTGGTAATPATTATAPTPPPTAAEAVPAAPDATFNINSVPVSTADLGPFPYLAPLKGYQVLAGATKSLEFDRFYFYIGNALVPVEGRVLRRRFYPAEGQPEASELMIRRNYENLLTNLGAKKLSASKVASEAWEKIGTDEYNTHGGNQLTGTDRQADTYVIRQQNKEIWVQLVAFDGYSLDVVEKAAMPQQVAPMKADELKEKLDTDGRVALYVNFDPDKATIRPESEPTVAEVVTLLRQNPTLRLAVQGHTDNTSTPAHNQQLSEGRAAAVVASLTRAGIAAGRLQAAGFGQSQPLADNATEEGKAQNRRVELVRL
ncbi:MAG: OmpA family protein [Hymenobacter sp.]|nr:OmpA family protein [Hymenobacter sp.]